MSEISIMLAEPKKLIVGDNIYELAPVGPFLVGQMEQFIKDRRRKSIAENAKAMGITDLEQVSALTEKPVTGDELNEAMKEPSVARMMIFYSLRAYQPDITLNDVAKLITLENMNAIVDLIQSDDEPASVKNEQTQQRVGQAPK